MFTIIFIGLVWMAISGSLTEAKTNGIVVMRKEEV